MHESFFGLQKRPFLAVPTLDRYCPVAGQEQAFQACQRVINRAEGPLAILGGTGLGKSMLCLRIADAFRRSFEVILLSSSQICSRRALLQSLLFELRMPYRDLNEGELRLSLLDRLQPSNENPTDGLVLIVDEAQTLSIKLLEELRMITNLTRDGLPRVRLILCGTHRLDEMLGHPQLESLNQRLAGRCYLSPLNMSETCSYITYKVERCGASIHGVMTDDAMQLVHRATDGVPRLIDQLCDQALRMAAESRQRPCSAGVVEEAWAGLQQLPLPWNNDGTPIEKTGSTIEFGSLEEDHENEFGPVDTASKVQSSPELFQPERSTPEPLFSKPAPIYNQPLSPIPSAGMGLSGLTVSLPSPTYSSTEKQEVGDSDIWDNFLSAQRIDLKPLPVADFHNESFPSGAEAFPSGSQTAQPRWLPDTVDYEPNASAPYVPSVSFSPSIVAPKTPVVPSRSTAPIAPPKPTAVPSNDQLFGNDFEEEFAVEPSADSLSQAWPEYTYDDLPLSSFSTDDALAYEVESLPTESPSPTLRPYSDLLDRLSSTNLEAMTFDPSTNFQSAERAEAKSQGSNARFESDLSRSSRSSILSFADLQQDHAPIVGDDRDLLVIEEDLPNQIGSIMTEPTTTAVVHPYKQLFSKLRG